MDYLLRDSMHIGVQYGKFDVHRLINTAILLKDPDGDSHKIGVTEGGAHSAEALVLARYAMFTQVYFHKTRISYDLNIKDSIAAIIPRKQFQLKDYLAWDDWRVLGEIVNRSRGSGKGAKACRRLTERDHYREVYHTSEIPGTKDLEKLGDVRDRLGDLLAAEESADRSWYKKGPADILVKKDTEAKVEPLSSYSKVIKQIQSYKQVRLYVDKSRVAEAKRLRDEALGDA
jgi:HD superfamily phosphohydrolase